MKSRTKLVAALLDEALRVYVASDLRLRVMVRSRDSVALDALATLAGSKPRAGRRGVWGSTKEEVILRVMRECLPFMEEQGELAEAVIKFLEAVTPEDMLSGLVGILSYRRVGRGGRDGI